MEDDPSKIVWEELELPVQNWISAIVPDTEDPSRYWISYNMYNQGNKIFYFNGEEHVTNAQIMSYLQNMDRKHDYQSLRNDRNADRAWMREEFSRAEWTTAPAFMSMQSMSMRMLRMARQKVAQ